MNRRTHTLLRQHIDLLAQCVRAGIHTPAEAGRMANRAGVPFEVACRVITRAHAERNAAIRDARWGRLDLRRICAEVQRGPLAASGEATRPCHRCKHSAPRHNWSPPFGLECRHPVSFLVAPPTTGEYVFNACEAMRDPKAPCGPSGVHFQPRHD